MEVCSDVGLNHNSSLSSRQFQNRFVETEVYPALVATERQCTVVVVHNGPVGQIKISAPARPSLQYCSVLFLEGLSSCKLKKRKRKEDEGLTGKRERGERREYTERRLLLLLLFVYTSPGCRVALITHHSSLITHHHNRSKVNVYVNVNVNEK